jgi:hypothetical protein
MESAAGTIRAVAWRRSVQTASETAAMAANWGVAAATFLSVVFVAVQAYYTRRLVGATVAAYLDGNILLSVVPYGGTGAVNLRLENVGAGHVEDVKLTFPGGLKGIGEQGIVDLSEGAIPSNIGAMGPREKREWYVGFTGHSQWAELPKAVEYRIEYRRPGRTRGWLRRTTRQTVELRTGTLDLNTYTGSLLRAYTGAEDLRAELERLRAEVKALSRKP